MEAERRVGATLAIVMEAAIWSAIALVALISTGTLFLLVQRFDALAARIGGLAARIDAQGSSLAARIDAQGADLGARIDAQGAELASRIDAQGAELGARIDSLSARLDAHIGRHAS
ncbi:MAG TPA: hypothetical protein VG993_12505 [Actinomycetota bacterium]|nr:hypothetical protein [Actinomycetota bacterium]